MPPEPGSAARFESIDWETLDGRSRRPGRRTLAFLATVAGLLALFAYDLLVVPAGEPTVEWWDVSRLDWLFLLSLAGLAVYVVVPLATRPARTRRYWRRLRRDPAAVAALAYLAVFFVLGALGPVVLGRATGNVVHAAQPPVLFSVDAIYPPNCLGRVAAGSCHGTWRYPFGTTEFGENVALLVVEGMRVSLVVALVASAIVVPLGVAVGTAAGYLGGVVDDLLMRYVDVQGAVPAFLAYVVLVYVFGPSLFLVVVVFGLFNWGGVARVVRGEVLQRRQAAYVVAARSAGAGRLQVLVRHVLPNVSGTVVTAVTRQIPTLVLVEAAISFLELNDVAVQSWGETIAYGLSGNYRTVWWVSTVTVLFLAVTVTAFGLLGDALRDVLDPTAEG